MPDSLDLAPILGRREECVASPSSNWADIDALATEVVRLRAEAKTRQDDAEFWAHQAGILRGLLNRLRYGPPPDEDDFAETRFLSSVRPDDAQGVLIEAACRRFDRAKGDRVAGRDV